MLPPYWLLEPYYFTLAGVAAFAECDCSKTVLDWSHQLYEMMADEVQLTIDVAPQIVSSGCGQTGSLCQI